MENRFIWLRWLYKYVAVIRGDKLCNMNKEDCMGQRHINEIEYARLDDYLSGRGKEKEWLSLAGIVGGEGKNL